MILKCKMCGGDIELSADKTCGMCSYCGSTMTFPKVDDEQRANMFNRGNHFRRIGEFDKALAVYERIVQEDEGDAEAHWCCALCRFGIEYVEDPNTLEYLPTCHRASFDSFLEDVDYLAALAHSDGVTKRQYQKDAAKIAEVQRGILATSQNEEPFDVFICYKESENDGSRTRDSLYAQAYLGKLMAERHVRKREALRDCAQPFDDSNNYKKALRFGDDKLKQELTGAVAFINERNETARKEGVYQKALTAMAAKTEQGYREAAELFGTIPEHKDAAAQREVCAVKAEEARKNGIYAEAVAFSQKESEECLKDAIRLFRSISGWRDADERIPICEKRIEEIRARQEAQRMEAERKAEARKRKNKRLAVILAAVAAAVIAIILLATKVILPPIKYKKAIALYEAGQYEQAISVFGTIGSYRDSGDYLKAYWDKRAVRNPVAAGSSHTVGLKADGTVVAVGRNYDGPCNVSDWKNIRLPER